MSKFWSFKETKYKFQKYTHRKDKRNMKKPLTINNLALKKIHHEKYLLNDHWKSIHRIC